MRKVFVLTILFISVFVLPLANADRGIISITPGVSVYEPGQKAIVAWNGQEEILILSTDVSSTQQTMVLEILPLPSEPIVEAASFQSFSTIQDLIQQEIQLSQFMSNDRGATIPDNVQMLFHQEIGAHNITVVTAADAASLVSWSNIFLSSSGTSQNITLGSFETVIQGYMNRGFRHYALDLITIQPQVRSADPILYKFNSTMLYYPLLITTPVAGDGNITIFTLTTQKNLGLNLPLIPAYYRSSDRQTASNPIQFALSTGDLATIDLRLGRLLPTGGWLNVLTFEGHLDIFTQDLMISEDDFLGPSPFTIMGVPLDMAILFFLMGAAAVFCGITAAFLMPKVRKIQTIRQATSAQEIAEMQ